MPDTVQLSRSSPSVALDYIHALFDDFMIFMGTRYFSDDGAIIGGIATFRGMPVTVIASRRAILPRKIFIGIWPPVPGRIPQGAAPDEAGRDLWQTGDLFCRYTWRVLRH